MSDLIFRGALADAQAIKGSIAVSSVDDRGMIDLRGDISDKKFMAAVKKVLGVSLPAEPRQSGSKSEITALWLSPDQWLITCPREQSVKLTDRLQTALENIHSLVVDVSDARSIIRIEGKGAKIVLMKGAPVDLTAPEFTAGYVRRIRFAELAAMVHVVSDTPETIDLYVFRSYALYAWDWLCITATDQSKLSIFDDQAPAAV